MDKRDFKSEVLTNDEFIKVYNFYEEYKQQMNKIDFDDMLIKTYELLKNNKIENYSSSDAFEIIDNNDNLRYNNYRFEKAK